MQQPSLASGVDLTPPPQTSPVINTEAEPAEIQKGSENVRIRRR